VDEVIGVCEDASGESFPPCSRFGKTRFSLRVAEILCQLAKRGGPQAAVKESRETRWILIKGGRLDAKLKKR
jgi:hypothetical protein